MLGSLTRGPWLGGSWAGLLSPACLPVFLPLGCCRAHSEVWVLKQRRRVVCGGGSMTPSLVTSFCLSFSVSCHVCFLDAHFLTSHPVPWGVRTGAAWVSACAVGWGELRVPGGRRRDCQPCAARRARGLSFGGLVMSESAHGQTREEGCFGIKCTDVVGWGCSSQARGLKALCVMRKRLFPPI